MHGQQNFKSRKFGFVVDFCIFGINTLLNVQTPHMPAGTLYTAVFGTHYLQAFAVKLKNCS